jgi:hypothetical protein
VFIVGAPRSGTSALAWALAQHSQLWTSSESDFLVHLFGNGRLESAFDSARSTPMSWLAVQEVDFPEFADHLGLGINSLFTSRSQGKRWIDKAPAYSMMMDVLAIMFRGASFVHIVRDGPSVVNSMLNSGFDELLATDFKEACRTWSLYVRSALDFEVSFPDRCVTVRHDMLTTDPDSLFAAVFAFLGVSAEPGPARFIREHRINSSFPSGRDGRAGTPTWPGTWPDWTPDQQQTFLAEARVLGPAVVW